MTESTTRNDAASQSPSDLEETPEQMWDDLNAADETDADGDEPFIPSDDFDDADWNADDAGQTDDAPAKGKIGTTPATSDLWANASEAQRKEIDRLQERDKRARGQVSATAKKMNELREQLRNLNNTDGDEELARLNEDYPDVAGPLVRTQTQIRDAVRAMSEIEGMRADEANALYLEQVEEQRASVQTAHPEWEKVIFANSAAFRAWNEDQPKAIRDAVAANMEDVTDAPALNQVLTSFKAFLAGNDPQPGQSSLSAKRQRQLQGSKSIAGNTRQVTAVNQASSTDGEAMWNEMQDEEERTNRTRRR